MHDQDLHSLANIDRTPALVFQDCFQSIARQAAQADPIQLVLRYAIFLLRLSGCQ